ncbi:MAG: ABC transporter substrate-binding protein [Chlorobi bacterium]|nr:ABC transporter substrate-binding protein [Chlorobiota bacterium]
MLSFSNVRLLVHTGMVCSLLLSGCHRKISDPVDTTRSQQIVHAAETGFREIITEKGFDLTVTNPWQGSEKPQFTYILDRNLPAEHQGWKPGDDIRIPVRRVICTSTTHIAFLKALGKTDHIVGISGKTLISDSTVLENIIKGTIEDIGYDRQIDYEKIVALQPDIIFMYGVDKQVSGVIERIQRLGIPVVVVGDYLEPSLLARAEWIRFFAAFFDEDERGAHYFDSISYVYNRLLSSVPQDHQPKVMAGLPWNEVWYVSGQGSLLSNTLRDAGGRYIFSSLKSSEAIPMDIEQVYKIGKNADIWVNAGSAKSLEEIKAMDSRLGMFRPVKTGMVFNNDKRVTSRGGNDYWESGVTSPDRILSDLIAIFHPDIFPGHTLYYYRKLP